MQKLHLLFILILLGNLAFCQNQEQISKDELHQLSESFDTSDPDNKALMNAISNNKIKDLALNRNLAGKAEHHFKYKVDVKGITDQKSSGRCWMFTGLNSLRPVVIKEKDLSGFEFSENYLFFYDQIEKANLFLEAVIETAEKSLDDRKVDWLFKNCIGDGGVWNSFANLVEKYGLVPDKVMPETQHSENTRWMNRILKRKLRENGLELREMISSGSTPEDIHTRKIEQLENIYRILALCLGTPPETFEYRFVNSDGEIGPYKTYSPKSFFKSLFPEFQTDNYVMLMNDPSRAYYKLYEIEYDRNLLEGKNWLYINLPSDKLKEFALKSIKEDEAMYVSCDVGKQINKEDGTLFTNNYDFSSLFGMPFGMNKKQRIQSRESGSSHAMLLMAADVDKDEQPTKWQFENSWGTSYGHKGYLTFNDDWFDAFLFRIVVHKKYIDKKALNVLKQDPILLPPWDPMYMSDN